MKEQVNHPEHYGGSENPYEVIKVIRALGLNFSLGNVLKYIARAGKKDESKLLQDLEKAAWYLNDEIETIKKTQIVKKDELIVVEPNDKYNQIIEKYNYDKLLNSGMFFEFYPELSGNYEIDSKVFYVEK